MIAGVVARVIAGVIAGVIAEVVASVVAEVEILVLRHCAVSDVAWLTSSIRINFTLKINHCSSKY